MSRNPQPSNTTVVWSSLNSYAGEAQGMLAKQEAPQQACLRQQLLRVGPLPQLVDQHDRVNDAAGLGEEHLLHEGLGATGQHLRLGEQVVQLGTSGRRCSFNKAVAPDNTELLGWNDQ